MDKVTPCASLPLSSVFQISNNEITSCVSEAVAVDVVADAANNSNDDIGTEADASWKMREERTFSNDGVSPRSYYSTRSKFGNQEVRSGK